MDQLIVVEEYPIAKWKRVEIGRKNGIAYLPVIKVVRGNVRKKSRQQLVFVAVEQVDPDVEVAVCLALLRRSERKMIPV